MKRHLAGLLAVVLAGSGQAQQGPWIESPITGHWYAVTSPMDFGQGESYATNFGGHLITIRSQAEQDWFWATFKGEAQQTQLYLGVYAEGGGPYKWISGEPMTYTNWLNGYPAIYKGRCTYPYYNFNGSWANFSCGQSNERCVIEVDSPDCNGNGVPDSADIYWGAADCNLNEVPDECELASGTAHDCNTNGTLDECDIAAGTSLDCNGNTIPDECEAPLTFPYCTAGISASGCAAQISGCGIPSATAPSGFVLSVDTVEGAKDGLFYFGTNGRQAKPWGLGSSLQCVSPPVKRGGLMQGVGTATACDGTFAQDLNALWCPACPKPGHNPGAGATVQAQLWYRDPWNTSGQTTSLSDAIEFTVGP